MTRAVRTRENRAEKAADVPTVPDEAEAPVEPESPPAPVEWAKDDDLGPELDWEPVELPYLGRKVAVRMLPSHEVARLRFLPEVIGISEILERMRERAAKRSKKGKTDPDLDDAKVQRDAEEYSVKKIKYMAAIAHLAVIADPDKPARIVKCDDCGHSHRASLWSLVKTERLQPVDTDAIAEVALRAQAVSFLAPFSKENTPETSTSSASTGESTPPTS